MADSGNAEHAPGTDTGGATVVLLDMLDRSALHAARTTSRDLLDRRHRRRTGGAAARRRRDRAPASTPRSTSCASHRRTTATPTCWTWKRASARRTGHRQPARSVQQGARLLHRSHARPGLQSAGRLPAPPDAEERRTLHHPGAEGLRRQGACRRRSVRWRARSCCTSGCSMPTAERIIEATHRVGAARSASLDALAALAERATRRWAGAGRSSCANPASADRSRPPPGRRGAPGSKPAPAPSWPTTAGSTPRAGCWSSPARTWAARAPSCARWR